MITLRYKRVTDRSLHIWNEETTKFKKNGFLGCWHFVFKGYSEDRENGKKKEMSKMCKLYCVIRAI